MVDINFELKKYMRRQQATMPLLLLAAALLSPWSFAEAKVRIFILAGQSNMQGFGDIDHLRSLAAENDEFYYYMDPATDDFRVRQDVRIAMNGPTAPDDENVAGDLRVGYGLTRAPTSSGDIPKNKFGPEVGFGWTMGDALHDPILLIKFAVGGSSLDFNWRPPSAPNVTDDGEPHHEFAGRNYRRMIDKVRDATANLEDYVPGHGDDDYEISGFVWLHGWFDALNNEMRDRYKDNLSYLISDVLDEFGSDLPVLIGELGQMGAPTYIPQINAMRYFQQQAVDMFGDNVAYVQTAKFVDKSETERFDFIPHYFGRADTIIRIGNAFGDEMVRQLALREGTSVPSTSPSAQQSAPPSVTPPHSWNVNSPFCNAQLCTLLCDPRFAGNIPARLPCNPTVCGCEVVYTKPSNAPSSASKFLSIAATTSAMPSSTPPDVPSANGTTDNVRTVPTISSMPSSTPSDSPSALVNDTSE